MTAPPGCVPEYGEDGIVGISRSIKASDLRGGSDYDGIVPPGLSRQASLSAWSSGPQAHNESETHSQACRLPTLPRRKSISFVGCITFFEVGLFVYTVIVNKRFESLDENPLFGPSAETLYLCGALYLKDREYWRIVSSVFLHAGLLHLAPNLFLQWWVGNAVECTWGFFASASLYLLAGASGSVLSANLAHPDQLSVGASGAVHGQMVVACLGPAESLRWPFPISSSQEDIQSLSSWLGRRTVALLIAISLGLGCITPGVDAWAHLGGFIAGLACSALWEARPARNRDTETPSTALMARFVEYCFKEHYEEDDEEEQAAEKAHRRRCSWCCCCCSLRQRVLGTVFILFLISLGAGGLLLRCQNCAWHIGQPDQLLL